MKFSLFLALLLPLAAVAQDIFLPDYNTHLTDVESVGLTKERVFRQLDRNLVDVYESVCSNRAHVWTYQLAKQKQITAGKIFVFYTDRSGMARQENWWYHVAPIISAKGELSVIDGGLPGVIDKPLTKDAWFKKIVNYTACREITSEDVDLIPNMFTMIRMPKMSLAGVSDCYYRITSAPYWTPKTIALNLLGKNEAGEPISFERTDFVENEVLAACLEVSTTGLNPGTERRLKRCRKFLGLPEL
jgi:hypothetical protein